MTSLIDRAAVTLPVDRVAPRFPAASAVERALKITVLSGGPGAEREVSLKSGQAVAAALRQLGHDVTLADVRPEALQALDIPADFVFIALHGAFGEDGQVQRLLDLRGVRYCGSGPDASATAMDKVATKCRLVEAGVPTPRFDVVTPERLAAVAGHWSPPAVVKPVAEGSSIDVVVARTRQELSAGLRDLTARYGRCMIEQFIPGLELTVGILGDQALPPIQIRTRRGFYDYQAKYLDDDTEYLFEIDLPAELLARVRALSLRAHEALGCRDFSRVDWMIDRASGQPYALEINTIPGFTDHSLLPKAAARAGLSFPQLCARIVELGMSR